MEPKALYYQQNSSPNGHQQPPTTVSSENTQPFSNNLLQQQQDLNSSQDKLLSMLTAQQHQLETVTLLYKQLAFDLQQQAPPQYSPIQKQYEQLLHQIQSNNEKTHVNLQQQKTINQEVNKTLKLLERKETNIENIIDKQQRTIDEHFSFKVMLLQLGYLGLMASCMSIFMAWIIPGGIRQTQEQLKLMDGKIFLIWSDQKKTQKFLGVPQK
jgi:hypothetical protein